MRKVDVVIFEFPVFEDRIYTDFSRNPRHPQSSTIPHFPKFIARLNEYHFIVLTIETGLLVLEYQEYCMGFSIPRKVKEVGILMIKIIYVVGSVPNGISENDRHGVRRKFLPNHLPSIFMEIGT